MLNETGVIDHPSSDCGSLVALAPGWP